MVSCYILMILLYYTNLIFHYHTDINECYTSNNGGCSGECINTDGAYHCAEGMSAVFIM